MSWRPHVRLWVLERGLGYAPRCIRLSSFVDAAALGLDARRALFDADTVWRAIGRSGDADPQTMVNAAVARSFIWSKARRHLAEAFYVGEGFVLISGPNPYAILPMLGELLRGCTRGRFLAALRSRLQRQQYSETRARWIVRLKRFNTKDKIP